MAGVEDEQKAQGRFALVLALLLIACVVASYALAQRQYEHPLPEQDCSRAYEYPMCARAAQPLERESVPPAHVYVGSVAAAILMLVLAYAALHASVRSQADIVPHNAESQGTAAAAAKPAAPAQSAAQQSSVRLGERTPDAIFANRVPPELIVKRPAPQPVAAPAAVPAQGVDVAALGGKKDG